MKNRVLLTLIILSAIALTACGDKKDDENTLSDEEKQHLEEIQPGLSDVIENEFEKIDNYENEQAKNREEEPDPDSQRGTEEAIEITDDEVEPYKDKEKEVIPFQLVEASKEIKESKINSEIVQVGNVVLPDDMSLTVKDAIELLEKDGEVTLGNNYTPDSLIKGGKDGAALHNDIVLVRKTPDSYDEKEDEICRLSIINGGDEPKNIMSCIIFKILPPVGKNLLNFFEPGYFYSPGLSNIYINRDREKYDDVIKQREKEYPLYLMNYEEAREYVNNIAKSAGLEPKWNDTYDLCTISFDDEDIVPEIRSAWDSKVDLQRTYNYYFYFDLQNNRFWYMDGRVSMMELRFRQDH